MSFDTESHGSREEKTPNEVWEVGEGLFQKDIILKVWLSLKLEDKITRQRIMFQEETTVKIYKGKRKQLFRKEEAVSKPKFQGVQV